MPNTLDTIELPDELVWVNQYSNSRVAQSTARAADGSLIVEVKQKVGGIPITLAGDGFSSFVPRLTVEELFAKSIIAGLQMTLVFRGATMTVVFDHEKGAVEVDPAAPYTADNSEDFMLIRSLNFLTV